MEPIIEIEDVHKYFGRVHALQGVSLTVNKGEVVVIVGPSGSGKSTLLRCINRLEEYDRGNITVDGIPLDSAQNINAVRREVGIVFQSFNLFPHLSVLNNLTLAQQVVRGRSRQEAEETAKSLLKKLMHTLVNYLEGSSSAWR
jgi:polar amino acid transport system ATP-binding protein